jgi:hypothetical protein
VVVGRRATGCHLKRLPNLEAAAPEGDLTVRVHLAYLVAGPILDWRKFLRIDPVGDVIAAGWHFHADSLVGTLAVV